MGLFDKIVGLFGSSDNDCDWYCDSCDAQLNRQPGFTTASGSWECARCGAINDVTEDNILSDEEAENLYQEECPKCGGHMARVGYSFDEWECEDCGCIAKDDGYGNLCYTEDSDDYDEDDDDSERLSVDEAAEIWASHGKDEDYMFGYTEEELEDAL